MKVACMLSQDIYKPGDLPPDGYLAWHEWAEVQRKAGIKQVQCGKCGLWRTPQELSGQTMRWTAQSRKGPVEMTAPVCSKCAAPNAGCKKNPGARPGLRIALQGLERAGWSLGYGEKKLTPFNAGFNAVPGHLWGAHSARRI